MQAFARFADELGLRNARVGMEVPGGYLQPPHYVALKALLGDALVQDGSGLVTCIAGGEVAGGTGLCEAAAEISALAWECADRCCRGRHGQSWNWLRSRIMRC